MPILFTDTDGQTHILTWVCGDGLARLEQEPYTEPEPAKSIDSEDE